MDPSTWLRWVREWPGDERWRERVDDPRAAEELFVEELRAVDWPSLADGLHVDELRLEGSYPDTRVAVELRAEVRYPGCRFAWHWRLWDEVADWDAAIFCANLVELVEAVDIVLPGRPGDRVVID